MRKLLLLIVMVGVLVATGGCWNKVELDERMLILGAAVDKSPSVEGKFMVTIEAANPLEAVSPMAGGEGGEEEGASWLLTGSGWTFWDAIYNSLQLSPRRLFGAHQQVLIVSEELAREGLARVIDFHYRNWELRRTVWLVIAKDSSAKDTISINHKIGGITSNEISEMINASTAASKAVQVRVVDFIDRLLCDKGSAIAGRIESFEEEDEDEGVILRYTGAAVFKKDKLVGWLDEREARGLNWIEGMLESAILVVKCPDDPKREVSVEVLFAHPEVEIQFEGDELNVTILIDVEGNIAEIECDRGFIVEEFVEQIERRMATVVKGDINATLAKAQELESDIIALGRDVHRADFRRWQELEENWDDTFANLDINVDVRAEIRRIGLMK
ncbi:Ger(x)C family spore germination protein [Desulfitispora alkaliphila]|uniref:Ger(x)C family spore germination protein n=1 Tax=Desulfitispora alkaliphila TaxID=622674 RepID=UPI003D1C0E1C